MPGRGVEASFTLRMSSLDALYPSLIKEPGIVPVVQYHHLQIMNLATYTHSMHAA